MSSSSCYCRLCAQSKTNNELIDLQNNSKEVKEILQKLALLNTKSLDIKNDIALPKTICFDCETSLNDACDFINKIDTAQSVLASLYRERHDDVLQSDDEDFDDNLEVKDELSPNAGLSELVEVKIEPVYEPEICVNSGIFEEVKSVLENRDIDVYGEELGIVKDEGGWFDYRWICRHCSDEFNNMMELRSHSKSVHKKCSALKCIDCDMNVIGFQKFVAHVRKHRNYLLDRCQYCDAVFSRGNIRSHIKEHFKNKQQACTGCGEILKDPATLQKHIDLYNTPKPRRKRGTPITIDELTCKICQKVFKSMNIRRDHEKRHSKDRKRDFACERCGKTFFNKGTLISHINTHDNKKPHVCKICNKSFLFPNMLRKHVESHSAIKKYSCDECGRAFRRPFQLKSHKIIHTDKMPYMCQFCSKSFRFSQVLKIHERLHTGDKPYHCDLCKMEFNNWSNYNKHMVRRHGMSKAKTKQTPDGIFPINPETGKVIELDPVAMEEWKAKILNGTKDKRRKKVEVAVDS